MTRPFSTTSAAAALLALTAPLLVAAQNGNATSSGKDSFNPGFTSGLAGEGYLPANVIRYNSVNSAEARRTVVDELYNSLLVRPNATGGVPAYASRQYGAELGADPDPSRMPQGEWRSSLARVAYPLGSEGTNDTAEGQQQTLSIASFLPSADLKARVERNETQLCLVALDGVRMPSAGTEQGAYSGDCSARIPTKCLDRIVAAINRGALASISTGTGEPTLEFDCRNIYPDYSITQDSECPLSVRSLLSRPSAVPSDAFEIGGSRLLFGDADEASNLSIPAASTRAANVSDVDRLRFPPSGMVAANNATGQTRDFVSLGRMAYGGESADNFTNYDNRLVETYMFAAVELDPTFQAKLDAVPADKRGDRDTIAQLRGEIRNAISLTCHSLSVTEGSRKAAPENLIINAAAGSRAAMVAVTAAAVGVSALLTVALL